MALKEYFDRRVPITRIVIRALSMTILLSVIAVFTLAQQDKMIPNVLSEGIRLSVLALGVLAGGGQSNSDKQKENS